MIKTEMTEVLPDRIDQDRPDLHQRSLQTVIGWLLGLEYDISVSAETLQEIFKLQDGRQFYWVISVIHHRSHVDSFIISEVVRIFSLQLIQDLAIVADDKTWGGRLKKWFAETVTDTELFLFNREAKGEEKIKQVAQTQKELCARQSMVIFPEGSRKTSQMGALPVKVVQDSQAVILPIDMSGAAAVIPIGKTLHTIIDIVARRIRGKKSKIMINIEAVLSGKSETLAKEFIKAHTAGFVHQGEDTRYFRVGYGPSDRKIREVFAPQTQSPDQ